MKVTVTGRHPYTKERQFILEYSDGTVVKRRFRDIILCEDPFFAEVCKPLDFNYENYSDLDYDLLNEEEKDWVDRYHKKTEFNKIEFISTFEFLPYVNNYCLMARNTPKQKRLCWCCNRTAQQGHLFCLGHSSYGKFIRYLSTT